jgi:hypothetical protein
VKAVDASEETYGASGLMTVKKITGGKGELLAFCDFPVGHWICLGLGGGHLVGRSTARSLKCLS